LSNTKNGLFFSAASCKKDTAFGAAQTRLGPSYFVRALTLKQRGGGIHPSGTDTAFIPSNFVKTSQIFFGKLH
jgi:hypothetical protein